MRDVHSIVRDARERTTARDRRITMTLQHYTEQLRQLTIQLSADNVTGVGMSLDVIHTGSATHRD